MKRLLILFLTFLWAIPAFGQSTTVSGQIADSNGQIFAFGTYKIEFFSNGLPTPFYWNGTPFNTSTSFSGNLDSTGSFSGVVVPSSNFITPVGTGWRFTVCSAATTQCWQQIVTVTGTTMNVTGLVVAPPLVIPANQFSQPAAYSDSEISGPILGFTYYQINTNCLRLYSGGFPPVWINVCSGGGGGGLTNFTAGNLSPLFTTAVANPTSTPALTFTLDTAGPNTVFANCTGSPAAPSFTATSSCFVPGTGTVTTFSSGNLSPLFTTSVANPTTTPAQSFSLSTAGAETVFANCTGSPALPSYQSLTNGCLPVSATRRVCMMIVGADDGAALVNTNLGPQGDLCYVPYTATVVEVMVTANAGTPSVIPGKNHLGTIANLVSSALATAAAGGRACSNTGGTTSLDGATTCSATLQNTSLLSGDFVDLVSGTAGGTAARMTVAVTYVVTP
jgi:hypothetical protein